MNKTQIGMFTAVAFAIGMAGINFSTGSFEMQSNTPSSTSYGEGAGILGHIEVIHSDSEGNILSYQQTDNAIVNDGRNCTAMLLFGYNTGCTAATAAGLGKYTFIGVGNGSALIQDTTRTTLTEEPTGDGLTRFDDAADSTLGAFTNATANSATAIQRITGVFNYVGSQASNPINQAGLFNQTSPTDTGVFALKNFPSAVNMNSGDQLTVNWDITIDGSNTQS